MARLAGCTVALALVTVAHRARAGSGGWGGLYDGRTLQSGGEAFVEGGFPGVGAGVLFGTSDNIDLGLRLTLTYSGVGTYATDKLMPAAGFDPRIVARFAVVRGKVVSFLFRLEPGVRFSRFDPSLRWGPPILFGAGFEYHATDLIGFGGRFDPGVSIAAGDFAGSPATSFAFLAQGYFSLRWGANRP